MFDVFTLITVITATISEDFFLKFLKQIKALTKKIIFFNTLKRLEKNGIRYREEVEALLFTVLHRQFK